ncbi:AraC family transcriptional regulator [Erythrobacter sp. CCH5-A1]|uniref:helix-turn-helix domain-containing protein n=1 Tax=Erythrobacter sp. CCH5-A1 TaxID=1768792 RepID=UPI0008379DA4|nr:AraC family transcriptional regulator [Erythrobacter sp. CCH5-A1]
MPPLAIRQTCTGIDSYDSARWTGGAPRLDRVRRGSGIATLLQCGGSGRGEVMEADVPETDHAVSLFRISTPGEVDRRITGTPQRAVYRAGEGCLLAPGTDSWWTTEDSNNAGWFHIHFAHEVIGEAEAAHNLRLETVPVVADRNIFWLVASFFELAGQEDTPDPLLWQSLGQVLLWRLMLLTAPKRRRDETRGGLAPWQARRTTEYLADNLDRRVTLAELAAIARLSPFHFARAFAKTLGAPPHRYQQQLRLARACELLARTDMRIIDVALAVGYESPQALARVFAQAHGVSPSQWRRDHGPG